MHTDTDTIETPATKMTPEQAERLAKAAEVQRILALPRFNGESEIAYEAIAGLTDDPTERLAFIQTIRGQLADIVSKVAEEASLKAGKVDKDGWAKVAISGKGTTKDCTGTVISRLVKASVAFATAAGLPEMDCIRFALRGEAYKPIQAAASAWLQIRKEKAKA